MDLSAAQAHQPTLATVDIVIIVGFLVLVTLVGYLMSNIASKGLNDYFLGGRRIPWWVLGISTATSNFDMAGTMIIVAVVFALGYKGFLVELRGGVGLTLAFLMIFLGKWLRRSRVMTSAEWMKVRFGTDTPGKAAHILSAVANIVLSLGMIIYFSKGAGKFLTHFLPLSEVTCTSIMVTIGLFYTLMAGLYGVVFTDVVQMILMTFTAVFVSAHAFVLRSEVVFPEGFLDFSLEVPSTMGEALLAKDPAGWESIFSMFGLCVGMWVLRTLLEGMGGVGGYTDQRFFAARSEREASLLTLESIVLSGFRWTMVAGLVIMGYHVVQQGGSGAELISSDAEQVLPVVLGHMLPDGIRGLVVAGLIAAAMSTFDSTLNAGASYVVRDLFQGYIRPHASPRQLLVASRLATVALCVLGVLFAAVVPNINQIWGLITMGIGAGLFVPLFLRWYWPRFNGYGFAAGTGVGIVAALLFNTGLGWPLYFAFPSVIGCATLASVLGAVATAPVSDEVLVRFYAQVSPWGWWGRIARKAEQCGLLSRTGWRERLVERRNDVLALCCAVPFQLCLLLGAMSFMFQEWQAFSIFAGASVVTGVGLYFFWYRRLKSTAECAAEDAAYERAEGCNALADNSSRTQDCRAA